MGEGGPCRPFLIFGAANEDRIERWRQRAVPAETIRWGAAGTPRVDWTPPPPSGSVSASRHRALTREVLHSLGRRARRARLPPLRVRRSPVTLLRRAGAFLSTWQCLDRLCAGRQVIGRCSPHRSTSAASPRARGPLPPRSGGPSGFSTDSWPSTSSRGRRGSRTTGTTKATRSSPRQPARRPGRSATRSGSPTSTPAPTSRLRPSCSLRRGASRSRSPSGAAPKGAMRSASTPRAVAHGRSCGALIVSRRITPGWRTTSPASRSSRVPHRSRTFSGRAQGGGAR